MEVIKRPAWDGVGTVLGVIVKPEPCWQAYSHRREADGPGKRHDAVEDRDRFC